MFRHDEMMASTALASIEPLAVTRSFERNADTSTAPADHLNPGDRLIGQHEFRYPGIDFRVSIFAGLRPLPADRLVDEAYSRLGYASCLAQPAPAQWPTEDGATLQAESERRTVGALSIHLDRPQGLSAESLYPAEIAPFRARGKVCEFTRLALDRSAAGREVLCSLFYMAYVYAHRVHAADHLFIEVNPHHQAFYARMLGFKRLGEEKLCPRVNAPAVLMHLDFQHTRDQIQRAREGLAVAGTTLYRYAAPLGDERLLIRRISNAAV